MNGVAVRLGAPVVLIAVAAVAVPFRWAPAGGGAAVRDPAWTLGAWGGPPGRAIALLALVAMAVGSLVPTG